jgi:hypothetical protein
VRHVGRRAAGVGLGEPEVEDLHDALRRDLDVGGLEIPVDDAFLVSGVERVGDLPGNRERVANGKRPSGHAIRERVPLDELEYEGERAGVFLHPVDRADVWMIQRGEQARLALEARDPLGMGREGLGEDLDRDIAPEPRIARAINLSHAAAAEQRVERVDADAAALPVRVVVDQFRGDLHRGRREKPRRRWLLEERPDLALQGVIPPAGAGHERGSFGRRPFHRRVIDLFDLSPAIGAHAGRAILRPTVEASLLSRQFYQQHVGVVSLAVEDELAVRGDIEHPDHALSPTPGERGELTCRPLREIEQP